MKVFPSLEAFLKTLRSEGIPVGAREVARLHQLFQQQPDLNQRQLKDTLRCLLAKTSVERRKFDRIFKLWLDQATNQAKTESPTPFFTVETGVIETATEKQSESNARSKSGPKRKSNPLGYVISLLAILLFAQWLAVFPFQWSVPPTIDKPLPKIEVPQIASNQADSLPVDPVEKYWTWVPIVEPFQSSTALFWPMLGISIAALALTGLIWRRFKRAVELPEGLPAPADGPEWLPMLAPESTGSELINSNQVRNAVWSVGRFVSEQYIERLDLQRTVNATAQSGGIPQLYRQCAVYDREVWLWIDEQSQHPAIPRLADELQASLLRAGLPARRAWFSGLPDRLTWEQGTVFDPLVWEGHRGSVIVAILSDGEDFIYASQSAHRLNAFKQMIFSFGQWPRLAFVDFSGGHDVLNRLFEHYNITHIGPNDLAGYLGGQAGQFKQLTPDWSHDLRLWAAAACLQNDALDKDTAYALHRHLGLTIPTSEIQALWNHGQDQAGRLTWTASQRTELLRWLATAEKLDPDKTIPENSLLGSALSFWRNHLAHQAHQRENQQTDFKPWQQTLAQRELFMKQGLIDLWDRPIKAATQLFELFESKQGAVLKDQISKALGGYFPVDTTRSIPTKQAPAIILPWRFQLLPPKTRLILAEMGLAGGSIKPQSQLQPTTKLGLALGLLTGVALSSLISALSSPGALDAPYFVVAKKVFDHPVFRRYTFRDWQSLGAGRYRYTVGSPKRLQTATVGFGQSAVLDWQWTELDNVESLDGAELWHAGTLPQPIRACSDDWPRRSLVVIGFDHQTRPARRLAVRLLDKGSADVILLGTEWAKHLDKLTGGKDGSATTDQLLVIVPKIGIRIPDIDFSGKHAVLRMNELILLPGSLQFPGSRPVAEKWGGNSDLLLWGGPEVTNYEGMKLVKVCGGTFSMGTTEADRKAGLGYDDESPRHPVTVDTFEINQTEVTERQYSSVRISKDLETAVQPKNSINWNDSLATCKRYQLDLPTEAQWEYAARAGTLTPWSFRSDRSRLEDFASTNDLSRVASKRPNPLGLFDMHGNVYEWTKDCYDEDLYKTREGKGTTIEPLNDSLPCSVRSLRGGSYFNSAEDLRSAVRDGSWPENESRFIGFRCVRAPRRQP